MRSAPIIFLNAPLGTGVHAINSYVVRVRSRFEQNLAFVGWG
jgi:hypothetical protein